MGFFDNIGDFYSGVQENQENLRTNRLRNMTAFSEFKRLNPDASSNDYMSAISAIAGDDEYYRDSLPSEVAVGKMAQENEKRKKRADEDLAYGDMKRDLEKNEMVNKIIDEESLRGDTFGAVATSVRAKLPPGMLPIFDKDLRSAEGRFDRTRQDEIQRRAKWYFDIVNDSGGNIELADEELKKYGFSRGIIDAIKAKSASLRKTADNDTFFKTKTQFNLDVKNALDMNMTVDYAAIAAQYPVSTDIQRRLVASVNKDGIDAYVKERKERATDADYRESSKAYSALVDQALQRGVTPDYERFAASITTNEDVRKKLVAGSNMSGDNEILDKERVKTIVAENNSIFVSKTPDAEAALRGIVIDQYGEEVASRLLPRLKSAAANIQDNKAIKDQGELAKELIIEGEKNRGRIQAAQNTSTYARSVASVILGEGTGKTVLDRGADILVLAAKQTDGSVSEVRGLIDSDPQLKKVFEEASRRKDGAVDFEAAISSSPGARFGKNVVRESNALAALAYPTTYADADAAQRNLEVVKNQVVNIKKLVYSTDKQDQMDALSQLIVLDKVGKENDTRKEDSLSVQLLNKEIVDLFSDPAVKSLLESQKKPAQPALPGGFDPMRPAPSNSGQSSFGGAVERALTTPKNLEARNDLAPVLRRLRDEARFRPSRTNEVNQHHKQVLKFIESNELLILDYLKELNADRRQQEKMRFISQFMENPAEMTQYLIDDKRARDADLESQDN